MKQYIAARTLEVADYIISTGATVRDAGDKFSLSKSTVHKDMQVCLKQLDNRRWLAVQKVLGENFSQRHIRGGNATKEKYKKSRR